jgi:hypothetical protein
VRKTGLAGRAAPAAGEPTPEIVQAWSDDLFAEARPMRNLEEKIAATGEQPRLMSDAGYGEPGYIPVTL